MNGYTSIYLLCRIEQGVYGDEVHVFFFCDNFVLVVMRIKSATMTSSRMTEIIITFQIDTDSCL